MFTYIFIYYLLGKYPIPPLQGRQASTPRKERRKASEKNEEEERVQGTQGETSYLNQGIDAFIKDEEKNGKQKKEEQERNRE